MLNGVLSAHTDQMLGSDQIVETSKNNIDENEPTQHDQEKHAVGQLHQVLIQIAKAAFATNTLNIERAVFIDDSAGSSSYLFTKAGVVDLILRA